MAPPKANRDDINWADQQLDGHEQAKIARKSTQAWWWDHGFATYLKGSTSRLFWCCKYCNEIDDKCKHLYEITKGRTAPPRHLTSFHKIDHSTSDEKRSQSSQPATEAHLRRNEGLDLSVFRSLLLNWVIHDNISFRAVESQHFNALLVYLEGSLEGKIGSRRSVKRWILEAYKEHAKGIKAQLAKSQSLIHLSFDLWTSRSLLSLNGIVAHYVDEGFEPRTFLLALPEQENEHTGANIANTVCNFVDSKY